MSKIRLANGNVYDVKDGATQYYLSMVLKSWEDVTDVSGDLSEENLKTLEFLSEEEEVKEVYHDKKLINFTVAYLNDGNIRVEFNLGDAIVDANEILNIILGGE